MPADTTAALSYVNVSLDHRPDGVIDARDFFHGRGRKVAPMQAAVSQMLRGGVRLVILSHGVNDADILPDSAGVEYMLRCLDAVLTQIESHDRCVLVRTASDLRRARRDDKLAILLHLTGCPTHESSQVLRTYHRLGVRAMHPMLRGDTYGGHWEAPPEQGLTPLGRQLIRELESLHWIIDTAHANDQTFSDILATATRPVLDSHTACRSILPKHRNRTDAQIAAIARQGGVVGVHFGSPLLAPFDQDPRRVALLADLKTRVAQYRRDYPEPYAFLAHRYDPAQWSIGLGGSRDDGIPPIRATLDQLIDHLMHMIDVAGIDHVCIGSDYALGSICGGVESADKLPRLWAALRKRGLGTRDVEKIAWRNLQRLLLDILPA